MKKYKCPHCSAPHVNKQEVEMYGCWQCGKNTHMIKRKTRFDVPYMKIKQRDVYECTRCHKVKDDPWVCDCWEEGKYEK